MLIIIPYLVLGLFAQIFQDRVKSNQYTAASIMKDRVEEIPTEEVVANNGSIDIIYDDLTVVHIAGVDTVQIHQFTMNQFTQFLMKATDVHSDYHRDVEYNEQQGFWLMVTFPVSIRIEIILQYNAISRNFNFFSFLVIATILGYGLLVVCSAILYAKHTARSFVKPMHVLQAYTRSIESGAGENGVLSRYQFRIKEFREFKEALIHMEGELDRQKELNKQAMENRKQLVRDISHDLKNPLASIQGYAELYQNHAELTKEQQENYMDCIYRNSVRANELIQSLFAYSQVDRADFTLEKEEMDLCEFLRVLAAEYLPLLEEKKLELEACIPEEEIRMDMDSKQMTRVLHNILDNACKYHGCGTKITIGVKREGPQVIVWIADDGIGMDEEAAKTCFEPFARADQVRNSQTGGSGLGLAIAKKIVVAHGGDIALETKMGEGCRFVLTFSSKH